jgi:hypothetical protein
LMNIRESIKRGSEDRHIFLEQKFKTWYFRRPTNNSVIMKREDEIKRKEANICQPDHFCRCSAIDDNYVTSEVICSVHPFESWFILQLYTNCYGLFFVTFFEFLDYWRTFKWIDEETKL